MRRRRLSRGGNVPFPIVFIGLPLLILVFGALPWIIGWQEARRPPLESVPIHLTLPPGTTLADLQTATVVAVIDGDTIDVTVSGKYERIRYFGVDTPERGDRCYREAVDRNTTLIGKSVLLLPDARTTDRFDRQLRYIFTPDGVSVDATLVAEGFGYAWEEDGRYRDQIIDLERQAQAASRGCLW